MDPVFYAVTYMASQPEQNGDRAVTQFMAVGKRGFKETIANDGMAVITNKYGFKGWKVKAIGELELSPQLKTQIAESVLGDISYQEQIDPMKETKNWLLNKIVKNKDKALFKASKKYLNKYEIAFINDKFKQVCK